MDHTLKNLTVIGALLGLLWLSACSPATPSITPTIEPTLDLNPFRTEVAATVLAQVTETLAAAPTDTPISPSPTPTIAMTSTPVLAVTLAPGQQATAQATLPGPTPTPGTNLARWVSQSVPDGAILAPGEAFTMTLRMSNVGTSTWTANYMLRFFSGNTFGAPNEILLGRVVQPGEQVDIILSMKAPTIPGDYRSDWVLANESRGNFKEPVFFKITVANPATNTPTVAPSATPTP